MIDQNLKHCELFGKVLKLIGKEWNQLKPEVKEVLYYYNFELIHFGVVL
jgi:hypothetical protein